MSDDPICDIEAAFGILRDAPYQPNPYDRLMTEALNSAEETGRAKERRRSSEWLADIGYGIDFVNDVEPPCTPRDVAEVYHEREPIDLGVSDPVGDYIWTIAMNTGWERCGNCGGNPRTCECDES